MARENSVKDASGLREWLYAFLFMLALAIIVFAVRLFIGPVFNLAFEICIFYIPTLVLLVIVVHLRMEKTRLRSNSNNYPMGNTGEE